MAGNPKALSGNVPQREEPKLREHDWDDNMSASPDRFGAPGWLNSSGGSVAKTCRKCGCELLKDGAVVHADVKIIKGNEYIYKTALGKEVRSFKPLSCPLFAFDEMSGAVEGKEIGREAKVQAEKVDIRVDETQYRITQLEAQNRALHEATQARITQLETENRELKKAVGQVTQIDLGQLAQKLFELAQAAKEKNALESVESKGRVLQVPKELVDVIDVVGVPVEKELPPFDEDQ